MFKKYGIIGLLLIIFVEVNFFLRIQPFASWYFPLVWLGYILLIDSVVYTLKKKSLLMSKRLEFVLMFFLSIPFWYVFELLNIFVLNWSYNPEFTSLIRFVSATVLLPAMFETFNLVQAVGLFDNVKLKDSYKISKRFVYSVLGLGFASLILPMILPGFAFPLIWLSFFLILDPVNYLNKQPSIIGHLKNRRLKSPLSLMLAGVIMGFFWEFWNYWAFPKWTYDIPFFDFWHVFEMPLLGYFGYSFFALEFYSMYWFAKSLLKINL